MFRWISSVAPHPEGMDSGFRAMLALAFCRASSNLSVHLARDGEGVVRKECCRKALKEEVTTGTKLCKGSIWDWKSYQRGLVHLDGTNGMHNLDLSYYL